MAGKYNATVAKIRTIYGRRITENNYHDLISMTSVADVGDYLKRNTHYSKILANIDTNTVHRGMLEDLLRKDMFETYQKITRFEGLATQEFYNYMYLRSEYTEILNCIRSINSEATQAIDKMEIYFNPYSLIDFIAIAKVNTFPELMNLIKKTPYYHVLSGITPDSEGRVDFSRCEYKLRTYYLTRLLDSIKFGDEDETLKFLINADTDLVNVINSYRLTAFFDEDENTIKNDMLPFSGRLSPAKLKEIYSATTTEEFMVRFSRTYYGRQMINLGLDVKDLEYCIHKLRYIETKRAFSKSKSAPLSVYAFMTLRGIEVHNLITIIEAIRYGLPSNQIESLIVI